MLPRNKEGYYADINEDVRDAFRTLLNVRPELTISVAIELYKEGEISLGKASEMIGVTTIEFKEILTHRGILRKVGSRSKEELESGIKLVKSLTRLK